MPNVIPARVANFFDLKGLTLACDAGFASTLVSFELGARYLHSGELDLAIVGGINGNSGWEAADTLRGLGVDERMAPGEGAFLFAITRESTARAQSLPVLAYVDAAPARDGASTLPAIGCGISNPSDVARFNYMGADAGWAILRALHSSDDATIVRCRTGIGSQDRELRLERPSRDSSAYAGAGSATPLHRKDRRGSLSAGPAALARVERRALADPQPVPSSTALDLVRMIPYWSNEPFEVCRPCTAWLPPACVIVTDAPALVEALGDLPEDLVVLSTAPLLQARTGWHHVSDLRFDVVSRLLGPGAYAHLRVLTDLESSAPRTGALATPAAELMALSDLTFLALKALYERLARPKASFVSLFLGAWNAGTLHPFAGMFTGMVKSSWLELGEALTYGVFTSSRDPNQGASEAQKESSAARLMAVVGYDGGRRVSIRVREAQSTSTDAQAPLNENSVVLAIGGARGISAEILKDLARRYRPQIYIIGSNDLSGYADAAARGIATLTRSDFLRQRKAENATLSIPALNEEFDRMTNARNARRNLDEIEQMCGAGKVHYRSCSVLDRDGLGEAVNVMLPANRPIDLVINAAGINRSSSIPMKSLDTFRAVRDLKVLGYQNLRHALRTHATRLWCNFGSFVGFTGQVGELDYAAANDFFSTASDYASQTTGQREFTICWTVWGEVGMVEAHPLTSSRTKGSGRYTSMTTAEGLHHFHRELAHGGADPSIVLMGDTERQSILARVPHFFDAQREQSSPFKANNFDSFTPSFYLDSVLHRDADSAVFERTFSLERDRYLTGHVVNGHPTLPGTFVTEIAAEAALALCPLMHVVALEELRFHHFLRVYGNAPSAKRIEARILETDASRITVGVRVVTDVTAPNGTILSRNKLHFEARVILMPSFPAAPVWEPWDGSGDVAVPDPYHFEKAPVRLTGVFVTTRDTRLHPMGKRGAYACNLRADDPTFERFVTPCLMMDGLARVGVLELYAGDYVPVAAPVSIRRIDIYQPNNDCTLSRMIAPGAIQLFVTPTGMVLGGGDRENRCVAIAPSGEMLLQMKGVAGTIIGYVHQRTGEFVTPEVMAPLKQRWDERAGSHTLLPAEIPVSDAVAPVTRVRWRPIPIPTVAGAPGRLANRAILVIGGDEFLASAVMIRLSALGAAVSRFDDVPERDERAITPLQMPDGIVDLGARGASPDGHARPWEPALARSVRLLKSVFERWSDEASSDRMFYMPVTALGGRMGYEGADIAAPYGGIWAGLAKTLPRELPNCNVKVLDIDSSDPIVVADIVSREVGIWDLFEVGYQAGQRYGLLAASDAAGPTRLNLDAKDVILVSGGGRGIGFVIAQALARRFRSRVVVTGRSARPDVNADWVTMKDEAFRTYSHEVLRAAAREGRVAQEKARLNGCEQTRELWSNLHRAQTEGLAIEYAVCDFTNLADVEALVGALGPRLSGVIHNAGVDAPLRLANKSTESFIATVRVKIAGFQNLLDTLVDRDLKFFCNVGSMAGRLGGMAGQTDYAAGNDGLARLGFWAQKRVRFPIKTLCWPTWKNLGLITNFDAAVKYMTAMEVEQGVDLWISEILQGGSGEIAYPGRPGRAVSPSELKGFRLVTPDFPSFDMLYSRSVYLGTVVDHRRARSMRTRVTIDPRHTPLLGEFRVGGKAALPLSLLLEYAIALGADEVVPDNWPKLRLSELRTCSIDLSGLVLSQPVYTLEREATGRWNGNQWVVDVAFATRRERGFESFGYAQIVFERDEAPAVFGGVLATPGTSIPAVVENARGLEWTGAVLKPDHWSRYSNDVFASMIEPTHAADVWATPYVPSLRLPTALIEASFRACAVPSSKDSVATTVTCDRFALFAQKVNANRVIRSSDGNVFTFTGNDQQITHVIEGLSVEGQVDQIRKAIR